MWDLTPEAKRRINKPVAIYAPAQNVTFGQTLGKIFLA